MTDPGRVCTLHSEKFDGEHPKEDRMKGTAEVGIKVKVICSRCGEELSVSVRDGVGNIPAVIEVDACGGWRNDGH